MKTKIITKDQILEIKIINLVKDLITKINLVITAKKKIKKTLIEEAVSYKNKAMNNMALFFCSRMRFNIVFF